MVLFARAGQRAEKFARHQQHHQQVAGKRVGERKGAERLVAELQPVDVLLASHFIGGNALRFELELQFAQPPRVRARVLFQRIDLVDDLLVFAGRQPIKDVVLPDAQAAQHHGDGDENGRQTPRIERVLNRLPHQKEGDSQPDPFPGHVESGPPIAAGDEHGRGRQSVRGHERPQGRVEQAPADDKATAAETGPSPEDDDRQVELHQPERVSAGGRLGGNEPPHDDQPAHQRAEQAGIRVALGGEEGIPRRSRGRGRLSLSFAHEKASGS